ncbi:MAG: molybdenum cofactor guanylyltransferase, partial [Chloroflexi bacterium]|nr:molybdenum cofactor guanylyltransferase [Chloroflexota bacterium]
MRNAIDHSGRLSTLSPHERSGLIFAGGRATRLGGVNKALLEIGGRRIIDRILHALEPLVSESVLLTNDDSLRHFGSARLVFDPEPHAGVLPALLAGLDAAQGEMCLAVACDMPFVSRPLFEHMLGLDADVVIPRTEHGLEPMHAVYRRSTVKAAIEAALARGDRRMISYFSDVTVREVAQEEWAAVDPAGYAFFNVNTPADREEA